MDLDYAKSENKMFINKEKIMVGKKNHPGYVVTIGFN